MMKRRRRLLAGMLALVMVMTNICANATTVWAGSGPLFQIGEDGTVEPVENPEEVKDETADDGIYRIALNLNVETKEPETYTIDDLGAALLEQRGLAGGLPGTWASSDDEVLLVHENGSAEVLKEGQVEVTFTYYAEKEEPAADELGGVSVMPQKAEADQK